MTSIPIEGHSVSVFISMEHGSRAGRPDIVDRQARFRCATRYPRHRLRRCTAGVLVVVGRSISGGDVPFQLCTWDGTASAVNVLDVMCALDSMKPEGVSW